MVDWTFGDIRKYEWPYWFRPKVHPAQYPVLLTVANARCPRGSEPNSPSPSAPCAEEMATEQLMGPTEEQLEILEYNFSKVNKHPDPTTLCLIAAEAGLSEEETLKWFKQRLAEWRKSEGLPSECGSVRD
ncbi:homeodomain-only protein isoform X2 [Caretta caretta]|uniref:homeodomain-only protein isoform X2 n=2 Tax=Cheloniidae TaxID=8465 RepID=UPI002094DABD|nr:homeodomain-only protein isoform X4 [Caretta caretta]